MGAAEWTQGFEFGIFPFLLLKIVNATVADVVFAAARLKNYVEITQTDWTVKLVLFLFSRYSWIKVSIINIIYIVLRFK
jgi:hypothetical protein